MQSDDTGAVGAVAPDGPRRVRLTRLASVGVPVLIVTLAAALRLWKIHVAPDDPFYDAATRSMAVSWHNFFFGALEPSGTISIDKIPADLWLQVIAVKLFGFNRTALHLPEALGGVFGVGLLYGAVRSAAGRLPAGLAAIALAVMPISVLTSRSDTMDSLMAAVLVGALWASVMGVRTGRPGWVVGAAALVGVAFNVKLTEALIPLPAFALMWWFGLRPARRVRGLAGAGAALAVIAVAWVVVASLTPAAKRPYPIGSHTGSIYRVVFVYNGVDRIAGKAPQLAPVASRSEKGPLRLFRRPQPFFGGRVGLELFAAFALALAALMARPQRWRLGGEGRQRERWWLGVVTGMWLVTAYFLFSTINDLLPRYVEAISPAVAGVLGLNLAALLRDERRRAGLLLAGVLVANTLYVVYIRHLTLDAVVAAGAALLASALILARLRWPGRLAPLTTVVATGGAAAALLSAPLAVSLNLIKNNASDAAQRGSGAQYSSYLRRHAAQTHFETASADVFGVTALVIRDQRPVLVLNDVHGVIVHLDRLRREVRAGRVRYIIVNHPCLTGIHCPGTTIWSLQNSVRVLHHLYRYLPSSGVPAA